MIKATLKYLVSDPDSHNERYYVRRPGRKKIRIRETYKGADGNITPEFLKAYFAALEILDRPSPPKTPREETFYWLADQYYRSSEFGAFDSQTQAYKRRVLNRFCQTAGNLPFSACRKEDVERSRDKRREKPGAADKLVKCLRALFAWAIEKRLATFNPAVGVKKINETKGWHAWTKAEVAIYRTRHPIGTKARLALELMITVGARISDAAQIGRQHEADGWLKFVAWKNRKKKSRKIIECLIRPELSEALAATPTGDLTYIVNDLGQPFTIHGLEDARLVRRCGSSAVLGPRPPQSSRGDTRGERRFGVGAVRPVRLEQAGNG
jgi:integrase